MQVLSVLSLAALLVQPQAPAKKIIDHSVYDGWKSVRSTTLSRDGKWLGYAIAEQEGDMIAEVKSTDGTKTHTFPLGQSLTLPQGSPVTPRLVFTKDSKFVVATALPKFADYKKARKDKVPAADQPKNTLVILNLATGEKTELPRVATFSIAAEDRGFIAFRQEPPKPERPTTPPPAAAPTPAAPPAAAPKPDEPKKPAKKAEHRPGETWTLRELATGKETKLDDVASLTFNREGSVAVIVRSTKDGTGDGVDVLDLATGTTTNVVKALGRYRVAVHPDGTHVAFTTDKDDYAAKRPSQALYLATVKDGKADLLAKEGDKAFPTGWIIAEGGQFAFSDKGTRLLFATQPKPAEDPEIADDDRVTLDVWNWRDSQLQPQQLLQQNAERNRSYLAIADVKTKKLLQVATAEQPSASISVKGDGDHALLVDGRPYQRDFSWTGASPSDVWLLNLKTGERRELAKKTEAGLSFSPEGNYLVGYEEDTKAFVSYDVYKPVRTVLNAKLPPIWDEEYDNPSHPPSFGLGGWLRGDAKVLVNDRHDVWAVDPSGKTDPVALTQGVGRRWNLRFRAVDPDTEEDAYDPSKPMLFSAIRYDNYDSGFYRLENGDLKLLFMEPKAFGTPGNTNNAIKARDAETVWFTRMSFDEFPDVWVADGSDFKNRRKMSNANPQQAQYNWLTVEHVRYTTNDGQPMTGMLVKPENFDPTKKYPMVVYFYERDSDSIHQYRSPSPSASTVNFPWFASNGYLILVPDIPYKIGYPGESAVSAIMPAVQEVIRMGIVDPKKIGIQGQSWGGYQVAYLITETNMFAAAWAGAPVSNMFSAYGGIRWGSGLVRQFQYEVGQSRIAESMWENPLRYLENSPIFFADKVRTPFVIMANDRDGAVPWYQGIEMFTALRRLERPAWMLVYNNEDHNLVERRNRKDLSIRLGQFFDHYLKGAPAPVWMTEGVPAVRKGRTMGTEIKSGG